MNIPFFKKNQNSNGKSYYFGLFLKEEEGIGIVFTKENSTMAIKETEHFTYSNGWENIVQDIDEMLFKFEQKMHITLDETIFFLYSHFIDEKINDIKKPYLQKIKDIVKSLELHALGYIECSEAVLAYLEKKEEMPLTAIVTELDKTNVGITIYKGGKKIFSRMMSRTSNLVDDYVSCFQEMKGKMLLPARILLYDSKGLNDESAKILAHTWSEDYFIQIPRVEILKEEEILRALSDVFAVQIIKNTSAPIDDTVSPQEVMGFVIGQDIQAREEESHKNQKDIEAPIKGVKLPLIPFVSKIKEVFSKIGKPGDKIAQNRKIGLLKKIYLFGGLFIILTAIMMNELLLHKATLVVYFPSQSVQKKLDIQGSLTEPPGEDLSITIATSSANYTGSITATGKRDIGDKSKGTVAFSSFDDKEKTFPSGTILQTGNLQFTLNNEVKVASASLTTDGSAKLPGKANGAVTALDIGPQSNIDKGQRFSIDNLPTSTYFAVNDSVFTGGSKKQVQTVSKKDMDDLSVMLNDKAKKDIQNASKNTDSKESIIPQLSKIVLRDLKYTKEVGEEASNVNLQATADFVNYYFDSDEMAKKISDYIRSDIKDGFNLEPQNIHYVIDTVEKDDANKTISLSLSIDAKATKKIEKEKILKSIIGKSKKETESIIKNQYGGEGYELTIKNPLPLLNSFTPFIQNNIRLDVSSL